MDSLSLHESGTATSESPTASEQSTGDMVSRSRRVTDPPPRPAGLTARIMQRLLARLGDPSIAVELPDGQLVTAGIASPVATVQFADRRTLLRVALDPMFQFPEAFADGRVQVHGSLPAFLEVVYRSMNRTRRTSVLHRFWQWLRRPRPTSRRAARHNIHHHYDIGNDFYRLWLDEQLLYTCAYFPRPGMTVEEAQVAKMDHVCRKLCLQPGMEVVEAGCGWGSLALHMARHYDVTVRAYNISQEQVAWARERAAREGLDNRVQFIQDDWRAIRGQFDVFCSVGMLEHVGVRNYRRLGRLIRDCLRPEGLGLIHSIGQNAAAPLNAWIERRIFPGACAPAPSQISRIFEDEQFSVLDVENIRLHYAETLRHWLERYTRHESTVQQMFGERFARIWRFYLSGSIAAFESGSLQLFQIVFAPGDSNRVPATREHLYASGNGACAP